MNYGTIIGNLYLGAGSHVLNNEGTITGNVDVDQRRSITGPGVPPSPIEFSISGAERPSGEEEEEEEEGASASSLTLSLSPLTRITNFTFESSGSFTGDVTVERHWPGEQVRSNSSRTYRRRGVDPKDPVRQQSAYIDGTLAIGKGPMTGGIVTRTPTPATGSTISDDGADGSTKTHHHADHRLDRARTATSISSQKSSTGRSCPASPTRSWWTGQLIRSADRPTRTRWSIDATVADASTVEGLSTPGIATLNALMQGGRRRDVNALGGAVQMLSDEDDVRNAGEQLAPETNFATQQAAWTLNFLTGSYIDNRLAGVGATARRAAMAAASARRLVSACSRRASASQAPAGRMSLGLGTNDGRMNIGANDGRMDAGIYDEQPDCGSAATRRRCGARRSAPGSTRTSAPTSTAIRRTSTARWPVPTTG